MDPLHITEFASQRYFDKLNQLKDANNQQQPAEGHAVEAPSRPPPPPPLPQSTFILPLRGSLITETVEEAIRRPEQKKSRLFSFRSKLTLHPKPTPVSVPFEIVLPERRTSLAESTKQIIPFDQLFVNLPNELQVQIIASLPLSDILNLRCASRSMHALISLNEAPIVRYHLDHHIPAYAKRLYPIPTNTGLNFHYLCGIWHRLHVAAKLSYLMCDWIVKEIFLRTTPAQKQEFAPQTERMRRRLIPLLFTIFHFFETYRTLHLQHLMDNDGHGLHQEPYTLNPIEAKIMSMYDDQTLLRVHQVFPLVISSYCRRLRPPSYVGRFERSIRGYIKDKPTDNIHVAALCAGGLRQVLRFWEVKGYNTRVGEVDKWFGALNFEPVDPEAKKRRGLLGLGRKKSTVNFKDHDKTAIPDVPPIARGSWDYNCQNDADAANFIFNTSLSAGMPMGPLSREQTRLLLPDLPVLQQIWLTTAEATILDRKIVERPADIKRNAQVMLDLIRDDGIEEEDEWWYGSNAPESVRPNLEAIDEDAVE